MKQKLSLLLAALLLVSALTACNAQTSAVSPFRKLRDDALAQSVGQAAQAFYDERQPVGLSVGVIRDGRVQFFNYGVKSAGGEAVTENTRFELGDVSQALAGVVLGTLSSVETLNIRTTNTVQEFMPYFELPDYDGEPIQWWHLAAHVSGLPALPDNFVPEGDNPFAGYSAASLRQYLSQAELLSEPGSEYLYSELGAGFLGYALSYAMRSPYEYLLQARVIWPLGMSNTSIFLTEEQEEERAMPHDASGQPVSQWDYAALQSAGGVKSTAYDLMLYLAANMGQIPVEAETLTLGMQEAQKVWFDDGENTVGLGLRHGQAGGRPALWQSGMTGGYGSYIGFVPETGTGVAVLCNSAVDVQELGAQILSLMQE